MSKAGVFTSWGYVEMIAPSDGATITPLDYTRNLVIDTAALAALTIIMPSDPLDGQPLAIFSTNLITSLSFTSAKTIVNPVTTLPALTRVQLIFCREEDKWYRVL